MGFLRQGELYKESVFGGLLGRFPVNFALYCLLSTESVDGVLLKAVNLGDDSDTTAAVTGGLAGVRYGLRAL